MQRSPGYAGAAGSGASFRTRLCGSVISAGLPGGPSSIVLTLSILGAGAGGLPAANSGVGARVVDVVLHLSAHHRPGLVGLRDELLGCLHRKPQVLLEDLDL